MHPVLVRLGPLTIYSYGLFFALGFAVSAFLASRAALSKEPVTGTQVFDLWFWALMGAVTGARLLFILLNLDYYISNPLDMILLNKGGLVFYGGLLGGILAVIIYIKAKRLDMLDVADFIAPFIALAHSIGRIGCFLNGCCWGKPYSGFGAVYSPSLGISIYPTQVYSSLLLLLLYIFLRLAYYRKCFKGQIFFLYLICYSCIRFFVEFVRGDSEPVLAGLTVYQLFSAGILFVSLIIYRRLSRR